MVHRKKKQEREQGCSVVMQGSTTMECSLRAAAVAETTTTAAEKEATIRWPST